MYFRVVITGFTKPNTDVWLLGVCALWSEWLSVDTAKVVVREHQYPLSIGLAPYIHIYEVD